MLHYFVLLEYLIQNMQRPSAVDHEIFGDDFKPVDNRLAGKDVIIVRRPQADPDSIIRKSIKAIFRHASLQRTKLGEGRNRRPLPGEKPPFESAGRLAFSRRRSGSQPCPCRRFCPCSRFLPSFRRPCPCKRSGPFVRSSPSFPLLFSTLDPWS